MLPCADHLASRLLIRTLLRKKDCAADPTSREGMEMDYVVSIGASGLLATIAYLIVAWIWDD